MRPICYFLCFVALAPWALATTAVAQSDGPSMRRCMLLPATDNVDGALAFPVFERLEKYIKRSGWCYYKSNSEILSILKDYKKDLNEHLSNPEVIEVIAARTGAGSLIQLKITRGPPGTLLEMTVLGQNGKDQYFSEKTSVDTDEVEVLTQTAVNWLEEYEKTIPYDGRVLGVLGDRFTIDIGKASQVRVGDKVAVIRQRGKRVHPLLKKVVEWETTAVARGQIFNVSELQAQGQVKVYQQETQVQKGDWVRITEGDSEDSFAAEYPEVSQDDFGKLGMAQLALFVGSGEASNLSGGVNKKMGGTAFGLSVAGEVWATRHWFGRGRISRLFSSYDPETGNLSLDSNTASISSIQLLGGYRYLPLGFFYGPQVNGTFGYTHREYSLDTSTADKFGEVAFSGLTLGVDGSTPIVKGIRGFLAFDFILSPTYEETTQLFGEADSPSSVKFEIGVNYQLSDALTALTLDGSFEYTRSKASFDGSGEELSFKNSSLKIGSTFTF